jgi:hypothetical protein
VTKRKTAGVEKPGCGSPRGFESSVLICRGVPPWAPRLADHAEKNGAPTEGRPYKLGHYRFERLFAENDPIAVRGAHKEQHRQ